MTSPRNFSCEWSSKFVGECIVSRQELSSHRNKHHVSEEAVNWANPGAFKTMDAS
eukprot:CAMPEP_0180581534 /NCGR_PEP_ID=MMETSP1037_2-20121125/14099_1 /TAXON_ID=632150 /ORGANISM="Azadinium spinosum, Strain 3D9" /LENGTH=54 /DNA_ID=CAMNT_0022599515 /DNA_START=162 /DNA_END=326 /DNA_ORIENTATION=-